MYADFVYFRKAYFAYFPFSQVIGLLGGSFHL